MLQLPHPVGSQPWVLQDSQAAAGTMCPPPRSSVTLMKLRASLLMGCRLPLLCRQRPQWQPAAAHHLLLLACWAHCPAALAVTPLRRLIRRLHSKQRVSVGPRGTGAFAHSFQGQGIL